MELKNFNYMLEIDLLKNSSRIFGFPEDGSSLKHCRG